MKGEGRGGDGREGEGQSGDEKWWRRDRWKGGSANRCMKSRESEKVEWGGESRGEHGLPGITYKHSTATTKLYQPTLKRMYVWLTVCMARDPH